ncbi:MAG TPA: hypothetical protein VMV19_06015 [Xanthobacteraceae bacterium]|nr:hypothetical protein [Xanthobacteraceae bacterium]
MFPNFRLMVAATLASIVMLICGLGMFATFRVSHAPLLRPVAATASPQSLADNMASSPLAFAPAEPFHRRFEISAPDRSDAVAAFTRFLARRENVESPPAASPAAPEPGATAAKEQPAAIEMPKDVPAAPGMPAVMPAAKAAPIAIDASVASLPAATASPPEAATPPAVTPAAAVEPAPPQSAEPTPVHAAAAPPTESEQQAVAVKPAAITVPDSVARESEPTPANAGHARAVAKSHRIRRATNKSAMQETQPTFLTAPPNQQWQTAQPQPVKARRRSVAASKTDSTATGLSNPLVGSRQ